jgi:hypothetical protein
MIRLRKIFVAREKKLTSKFQARIIQIYNQFELVKNSIKLKKLVNGFRKNS